MSTFIGWRIVPARLWLVHTNL